MRARLLVAALILLLLVACGTKLELPTPSNVDTTVFGAGDTSYIRVAPNWDAESGYSFQRPWDILVGADGYVFVVDRGTGAINVYNRSGEQRLQDQFGNDFTALQTPVDTDGDPLDVLAISQDPYLNLLLTDSSNNVYVWNQYVNNVGIQAVAQRVLFQDVNGSQFWVTEADSFGVLLAQGARMRNVEWGTDDLEQWLGIRPFWDGDIARDAQNAATHYLPATDLHFVSVAANQDLANLCYVADAHTNTIVSMDYRTAALVQTTDGSALFLYHGRINDSVAYQGTGNGTVKAPRGMAMDATGALYYAQWGENFGVHKVGGSPSFDLGFNDIMDLERFAHPSDVAVDQNGLIYVADTEHGLIQQFSSNGQFTYNIGVSRLLIDNTLVDVADILSNPRAVGVDSDGIVYIADTGNRRVMRYRLSTELDYQDQNTP